MPDPSDALASPQSTESWIIEKLQAMPLLASLSRAELEDLASQGAWQHYEAGDVLFHVGEEPRAFYLISDGYIQLYDDISANAHMGVPNQLGPGDYLGAGSLLTGKVYDQTAVVSAAADLFAIRKRHFYQLLEKHPEITSYLQDEFGDMQGKISTIMTDHPARVSADLQQKIAARLEKIPLFEKLSDEERAQIATLMHLERHPANTVLCQQGEVGRTFYLIDRGLVIVRQADNRGVQRTLNQLGEGDFFGETSLLTGEPRDATITVLKDVEVFVLDMDDFDRLLEQHSNIRRKLNIQGEVQEKLSAKRFSGREEGEFPVAFERKHPFILVQYLAWPVIAALLTIGGEGLLLYVGFLTMNFVLWVDALALIPWLLWVAWQTYDWYNDDYIVTDRRVIHIERVLFFFEERHEATLEKIQNINMITPGPIAKWLNFHDLIIQTAGSKGSIIFKSIPRAEMVRDLINQQKARINAPERAAERERMRQDLREEFGWTTPNPAPCEAQPAEAPAVEENRPGRITWALSGVAEYFMPRLRLEEGDTIIWRKHWYVLLTASWKPGLLVLLFLSLLAILAFNPPPLEHTIRLLVIAVCVVALIVALARLWWQYEDWRNDLYILSSKDIKDIDREPLWLHEEVRQANLGQVQDVRYEIPGPLAVFLGFGNVLIETAGKSGLLTFLDVAQPAKIQEEIFQRIQEFERRKKQREWADRRSEMIHALGVYSEVLQEQDEETGSYTDEAEGATDGRTHSLDLQS